MFFFNPLGNKKLISGTLLVNARYGSFAFPIPSRLLWAYLVYFSALWLLVAIIKGWERTNNTLRVDISTQCDFLNEYKPQSSLVQGQKQGYPVLRPRTE